MYKITSEKMDNILQSVDCSMAGQKAAFEACGLNASDAWDGHDTDISVIVREKDIQAHLNDVIVDPLAHISFDDDHRMKELADGAALTPEELSDERAAFIEWQINEEYAEVIAVVKISDNISRSAFVSFIARPIGQLGMSMTEFVGLFSSEEEAHKAVNGLNGIVKI